MRAILTDEQRQRYDAFERERRSKSIERALMLLQQEKENVSFLPETRQKLIHVLVEHCSSSHFSSPMMNPYGACLVFLEADRIQERWRPLLNEPQREVMDELIKMAKRMEPALRSSGMWPQNRDADDEEVADASKE